MKQGMNKDWTEAIREKILSDGAVPSPAGWEAVGRRVRRSEALRRGGLAAAVLLPVLALLIWSPWRQPATTSAPIVADGASPSSRNAAPVPDISSVIPDPIRDLPAPTRLAQSLPSSKQAVFEDETPKYEFPSSNLPENEDGTEIPDQVRDEEPPAVLPDLPAPSPFISGTEPESQIRRRPRISVGVSAGSGTVQRETAITMRSAPYIAALAFLNTLAPNQIPKVKSSISNSQPYVPAANAVYSESSIGNYHHDLPLSVGVQVRLGLTPKLGLESGLEYTYLHSVEESALGALDQRLHFIGIPIRMNASLWARGGFDMYAGLGGKVEKCLSASLGIVKCEESRLQWAAEAFGGIQYKIGDHTKLYFQPALTWYLSRTDLVTYRTEHPLGLSVQAGLRFDL